MKRYFNINPVVFLLVVISLTVGCYDSESDGNPSNPHVSVRATLESEGGSTADIRVYVEGADGNILTGAVVLVSDTQKRVKKLEFDPDKYCYTGFAPVLSDGLFTFTIDSRVMANTLEFPVAHTILTVKPVVAMFQDAGGNSVLSGQPLSSDKEIQIAWNSAGSGVVYQVSVKTAFRTLYSVSTNACNISIEPSFLPPGVNYMFEIIAQKIYGDPYFRNANYYSVSVIRSAMVSFNVQ